MEGGRRLDRLLALVEEDKRDASTRSQAAQQAGDLAAMLPREQQQRAADRLCGLLQSTRWSVRSAAADGLGALAQAAPHQEAPSDRLFSEPMATSVAASSGRLCLSDLHPELTAHAQPLLASDGSEFLLPSSDHLSRSEHLRRARHALLHRLGLAEAPPPSGVSSSVDDIVSLSDLSAAYDIEHVRLKPHEDDPEASVLGKRRRDRAHGPADGSSLEWPLERVCDKLLAWIFHRLWHVRHGAVTALTRVLSASPRCPGVRSGMAAHDAAVANAWWCEDACARLVCVLGLDRFNDFHEDSAIAPVREAASKALAASLARTGRHVTESAAFLLLRFVRVSHSWEQQQGALLGLKFLLALRPDVVHSLFDGLVETMCGALDHGTEDVVCTACAAMEPIAGELRQGLSGSSLTPIIASLWRNVDDSDPLSACAGAAASLLAAFLSEPSGDMLCHANETTYQLLERLAAVVQHPSEGTRKAVLRCARELLKHIAHVKETVCEDTLNSLETMCILAFQASLLEPSDEVARQEAPATFSAGLELLVASLGNCEKRRSALQRVLHRCFQLLDIQEGEQPPDGSFVIKGEAAESELFVAELVGQKGGAGDTGRLRASELIATLGLFLWKDDILDCFISSCQRSLRSDNAASLKSACWCVAAAAEQMEYSARVHLATRLGSELEGLMRRGMQCHAAMLDGSNEGSRFHEAMHRQLEPSKRSKERPDADLETSLSISAAAARVFVNVREELEQTTAESIVWSCLFCVEKESNESAQAFHASTLARAFWLAADHPPTQCFEQSVGRIIHLLCVCEPSYDEYAAKLLAGGSADARSSSPSSEPAMRGSYLCLKALAESLSSQLLTSNPALQSHVCGPLRNPQHFSAIDCTRALFAAECLMGYAHQNVRAQLLDVVKASLSELVHGSGSHRLAAAEFVSTSAIELGDSRDRCILVERALAAVNEAAVNEREWAIIMLSNFVSRLTTAESARFVKLLLMPSLRLTSDSNNRVRRAASKLFAALLPLWPLQQSSQLPSHLSDDAKQKAHEDGHWLQQLLDRREVTPASLPSSLKLTMSLRQYQKEGIDWLCFLRRLGLHGALCDDMGLGKTLQALVAIAADAIERRGVRRLQARRHRSPAVLRGRISSSDGFQKAPSGLTRLLVHSSAHDRLVSCSICRLNDFDLVVTSYEILRRDVSALASMRWAYCALDEGHCIRNPTSKVAQACKRIEADHRLVLTGTPVQNGTEELWAIFDFLMPGMLGDDQSFKAQHSRKKRSADYNALSLGVLHRKVLPFILRRTKEDVMQDLPPKVIQDVYVEPGPLQLALRNDAQRRGLQTSLEQVQNSSQDSNADNVFAALNFFRRLWSHPLLALEAHPYGMARPLDEVCSGLDDAPQRLEERKEYAGRPHHSPKLEALGELLDSVLELPGRKALVFAQSRRMLDLVESLVLHPRLTDAEYARLDGAMSAQTRSSAANRLSTDDNVRVLLLTTSAGGQGLNLAAADTVIFLEHDWNPKRDLQAMDRAHRLGQRRAVTVYRILVRGSMEEHIISTQQSKNDVANAIVNEDNATISPGAQADPGTVLDVIASECGDTAAASSAGTGKRDDASRESDVHSVARAAGAASNTVKELVRNLDERWTESMKQEEVSVEAFLQRANVGG